MRSAPVSLDRISAHPRRDATRARILAGAREVFFTSGFAAAMMDEIAQAAGTRRSTIYLHFREKEDMLAAIADDYLEKIGAVVAQLPSRPTRGQIGTWIDLLAQFVAGERAPTELLVALSHLPEVPPSARRFGHGFIARLSDRLPAFAEAVDAGGLAEAWAVAALENLCWALCYHVRHGDGESSRNRLTVAAEMLSGVIERDFRQR